MKRDVAQINPCQEIVVGSVGAKSRPWQPQKKETTFVNIMDEEVKLFRSRRTGRFTKAAWTRMREQMVAATGYNYTQKQLKYKYGKFRTMFYKFKSLLAEPGVSWETTNFVLTASPDVWERVYKVNNMAKRFRRQGCRYYRVLCRIFGHTPATVVHAHPPTKPPSSIGSFDPPNKNKSVDNGEFASDGSDSDSEESDSGTTESERKMRVGFYSNLNNILKYMIKTNKMKLALSEKRLALANSVGARGPVDPRALKECVDALNSLENVDGPSYAKALGKLLDEVSWRDIFLSMPDKRKRDLVVNL